MKQEQEYYKEEKDNPEEEPEEEDFQPVPDSRKNSARSFTQIQIVACAAVLMAALLLRTLGGSFYQSAKAWYLTAVGDSVLPEEQVENIQHTVVSLWSSVSSLRPNGLSVSSEVQSGASSGTASDTSGENPSSTAASSGNAGSASSAPNSAAP